MHKANTARRSLKTGPSGPAGTGTVTVVSNSAAATTVTVNCPTGTHAIAGGGRTTLLRVAGSGGNAQTVPNFQGTFPSNSAGTPQTTGTNPTSWTATFSVADASNTVYAICAP